MSRKGKDEVLVQVPKSNFSPAAQVAIERRLDTEKSAVTKWEFLTFILTDDAPQVSALASLGEQGWELVAAIPIGNGAVQKLFFKRQVL